MTKVINIPGRLHSVEQGNIVAGANEVYDDTKGKKQNVINSETDAELLRLEQTKQDNLTFDNAPTENSNNPVKSGGVYAADLALQQAIEAILLLIPSAATSLNQLADKAFVSSSISTATATFRGTYNVVTDLHLAVDATHAQIEAALASVIATADNNDYCFVQTPVSTSSQDIQKTSRYKFNGTAWVFEYDLNTSGFTSAQWAAINSGITAALVTKLGDLPTATELSIDLQALSTAIGSEETRAKGVEQGLSTAIQGILDLIPSAAASSNKLTDKAYVDGLIQAITALIPAEATDENQLADKAYVLAQILAATPAFKGQFETLAELQAVASTKAGDLGIVRTKDSDGYDVFTFYQYLNNAWNVFYTLSHHPMNKPATTGTTGDYPYNGMGRVVIPKNMVSDVNILTQDSFEDGNGNPLTNTVFVIQYEFTLGEDVTIPANCVLEFGGGSLSGNKTLTGNNTSISAGLFKIFHTDITLAGTWNISKYYPEWLGAKGDGSTDDSVAINKLIKMVPDNSVIKFSQGKTYACFINVFRNNITLMGYGSKLKGVSGAEGNVVTVGYPNYTGVGYDDSVDPSSITWVYFNNINMYGFDIDGNYANVPHSETDLKGHGVLLTLIGRSTFKDMYIHDCHVTCFDNASESNHNNIDITVANGGNSSAYGSNNYYPNFDVNSSYYCNFKVRSIGGKHGCRLDNNCRFNNCDFNIYDPALTGLRLMTAVAQNQLSDNIVNAVIDGNNKCTMLGFSLYGTDNAKVKNNIINVSVRKCNTTSEAVGIGGYGNIVNITSRENTAKVLSFSGKSNVITLCSNDDGTGLSGDTTTPLVNCVANSEQNKVIANITNFTGGRVLYVGTNCINNDIDISTDKAMIISDQSAGKSLIKQKYNARPILWENSSPTSAVAASFKIDISNYLSNGFNYLLIEFAESTSDNLTVYYAKLPAVVNRISSVQAVKFENNQTVFMNRSFKYDQGNGKIFFWGGNTSTGGAATADDTILIPLRVYGCYIDG